jgi:argininosuccinate lyase
MRMAACAISLLLSGCGVPLQAQMPASPGASSGNDRLYRLLIDQNKAQLVMLSETGLLESALVQRLARALSDVDAANQSSGGRRSSNYLDLEEQLISLAGPAASNIHLGRSRNDLGAASERMVLREELLELSGLLAEVRERMAGLASQHVHTVIPGYTHSVQAQPTTLAHYLGAFIASFERDDQRLREVYARINASPLGAAAFTTSGFRLPRRRLAELLGFTTLVENSYDAIMVSTVDSKAEVAAALAISSLNAGRFAQQFLIQYSDSRPGLNLADEAAGHSSIMPQKRNPRHAERIRILASAVLGEAQTVMLTAHNTPGGEAADFRIPLLQRVEQVTRQAAEMLRTLSEFVTVIRVDPARTLELVNADYSVMTELADTLLRQAGVPFRTGHEVASQVAAHGRASGKRPLDLDFAEVDRIYRKVTGRPLPLSPAQLTTALSAESFVRNRQGTGGPQPLEMQRMLEGHRASIRSSREWLKQEQVRLRSAQTELENAFQRLR